MTPSRPYLVRAIYEWLVDNQATPYLLLDANAAGARVPIQYVKDGKIVLNIAQWCVDDGGSADVGSAGDLCPRERSRHVF